MTPGGPEYLDAIGAVEHAPDARQRQPQAPDRARRHRGRRRGDRRWRVGGHQLLRHRLAAGARHCPTRRSPTSASTSTRAAARRSRPSRRCASSRRSPTRSTSRPTTTCASGSSRRSRPPASARASTTPRTSSRGSAPVPPWRRSTSVRTSRLPWASSRSPTPARPRTAWPSSSTPAVAPAEDGSDSDVGGWVVDGDWMVAGRDQGDRPAGRRRCRRRARSPTTRRTTSGPARPATTASCRCTSPRRPPSTSTTRAGMGSMLGGSAGAMPGMRRHGRDRTAEAGSADEVPAGAPADDRRLRRRGRHGPLRRRRGRGRVRHVQLPEGHDEVRRQRGGRRHGRRPARGHRRGVRLLPGGGLGRGAARLRQDHASPDDSGDDRRAARPVRVRDRAGVPRGRRDPARRGRDRLAGQRHRPRRHRQRRPRRGPGRHQHQGRRRRDPGGARQDRRAGRARGGRLPPGHRGRRLRRPGAPGRLPRHARDRRRPGRHRRLRQGRRGATTPRRCSTSTSTPTTTGWSGLTKDMPEVSENLEPLSAFGISGWVDGDVVHGMVKLTTD